MSWNRSSGSTHFFGLVTIAVLAAAVSGLPAGIGNLGRATTVGAAGTSTADVSVNPTVSKPTAGLTMAVVRDNLVSAMNDPNFGFAAATFNDPADPLAASYTVTKVGGAEVDHLKMCENDPNIDNLGVAFVMGKDAAVLNKPAAGSIAGNGNYVLSISTWDSGTSSQTFSTIGPPNNTVAGLNASIVSFFVAAGFSVSDDGLNFIFRKPGDMVTALRVSSTDTGQIISCIDVTKNSLLPGQNIPTVSEIGMFLLIALMTSSAIWMLRRKSVAGRTRS